MPLVRVDMPGHRVVDRTRVGLCVQETLHAVKGVPMDERFQVFATHATGLVVDPSYLGIERTMGAVIVQVFLNAGRDAATKARFYAALADSLRDDIGLRREDLVISLVEVRPEDWSFGNGEAQLAPKGDKQ